MNRLVCLITATMLALSSIFTIGVSAQTPTPVTPEITSKSFKSTPSVVTFFRTQDETSLSSEVSFNLKEIPKKAVLEKVALKFTQEGTSSGILKIIDKTDGEIIDSLAMGAEGKKSTERIETLVSKWVADPTKNFGIIFQTSELELDSEVILDNIQLSIDYSIPDNISPEIEKLELKVVSEDTVNVVWATNEDSAVFVEYGKTSEYGQKTEKSDVFAKEGNILIANLNKNITYHMRFIAEDEAGNITKSPNSTFSTSSQPSTSNIVGTSGVLAPRLLNLELGSTSDGFKVDLAWSKSDSDIIDGYIVYRNSSDDPYIELARLESAVLRYSDVKVEAGTNYSYYVVAYLGVTESGRSPVETVSIPDVSVLGISDFLYSGNRALAIGLILSGIMILLAMMYFLRKRIQENMAYNEKISRHSRLHNYLHDPDYYVNGYEDEVMEKQK